MHLGRRQIHWLPSNGAYAAIIFANLSGSELIEFIVHCH